MALIEVIDVQDPTGDSIVIRFPETGDADIKLGAQLVVRESQVAIFYRGGQALDTFGPGRHTLSTANLPLLRRIINLPFGGETPFKAEVYFVSTKTFLNRKWGTKEPIVFRDQVLKVVRLRSFGVMSFRIVDPQLFVNKVVGTQGYYTSDMINDFLRNMVVARLNDVLGENLKTLLDLPALYDEIGIATKARVADDFGKYGIELEDLAIGAITPPPEVQKKIDERSGMGLFEDNLAGLQQYQMAYAMRDLAKNEGAGGVAGAGMGLGMGLGMGFMMPGVVAQATPGVQPGYGGYPPPAAPPPGQAPMPGAYQQPAAPPPPAAPAAGAAAGAAAGTAQAAVATCHKCHAPIPAHFKFCPSCGEPVGVAQTATASCPKCGQPVPAGSKFCPSCGAPMSLRCPKCGSELVPGAKFCPNCGQQVA